GRRCSRGRGPVTARSVAGWEWIARADGSFKQALDRVKYASRHSVEEVAAARDVAVAFFDDLEAAMGDWLLPRESLADNALLPFVRQFAFIDKPWFDAQPWSRTQRWLQRFLMSPQLAKAMEKENVWRDGDAPLLWPKLPADHHSSRPLPRSTAALQNKSP
ncbi:glutathione S-transferase C-terminal domain-containing protein, partial [Pseudorhodobacter sp.]|uniref:glutathione S-transferase C-terminal domain-containing protein n=1 Tax=Pseudorhodobacter sp. TaxID=1934400 RepID=UPI00264F8470|nr:hypothetical protein [Pseudorhodobacter sp.]